LGAARGGGFGGSAACHIGWGIAFGLVGGGNGEIPAFLQKYAGGHGSAPSHGSYGRYLKSSEPPLQEWQLDQAREALGA